MFQEGYVHVLTALTMFNRCFIKTEGPRARVIFFFLDKQDHQILNGYVWF